MNELTCDEVIDLAPAYVLGALERDEEATVTEHLRTCAQPHPEMAEFGEIVSSLDESIPLVEPPPSLRGRILAAAAADLAARHAESAPTGAGAPRNAAEVPVADSRVVSITAARTRQRQLRTWAMGIAAVFAIVALGGWNLVTQQQLADARSYQQRLASAIAQAGQPGAQVAVLTSTAPGSGPGGLAVMLASGNGTLVVSGLAPTTGNQVYEAWVILEGQPPTPVAGFTVGSDGIGYFDKMPNATGETLTIAITLEPAPNPSAPSSAPIAAGVATSSAQTSVVPRAGPAA